MGRYILKRLGQICLVLLGVIVVVFILRMLTPGDPVDYILSENATEQEKEEVREELGLNDPIVVQFGNYVVGILQGDMGTSYISKQPVFDEIISRLPISLFIAFSGILIGLMVGIPMGVGSALHHNSWLDNTFVVGSMVFSAIPNFALALIMILIMSVWLGVLPSYGVESWTGFIMPIATMAFGAAARTASITRTSMLEVIRQDYIRTAKAKGLNQTEITVNHVLRNGMIPVVNHVSTQLAGMLGGAIIVETVFGIPGLGKYIAEALTARNFPAVQGGVIVLAMVIAVINLVADITFVFVDPRLRTSVIGKSKKKQALKLSKVEA